jgi:hypothetical protein
MMIGTTTRARDRECGAKFAVFAANPLMPHLQARFRVDTGVAPP